MPVATTIYASYRQFRHYLTPEATRCAVQVLITSRLDYCNSLSLGLPLALAQIECLQQIQNKAARLVTRTRQCDHITPVLRALHWLLVHWLLVHHQTYIYTSFLSIKTGNCQKNIYLNMIHSPFKKLTTSYELNTENCIQNSHMEFSPGED